MFIWMNEYIHPVPPRPLQFLCSPASFPQPRNTQKLNDAPATTPSPKMTSYNFATNTRIYRFFEKDTDVSHSFVAPAFMVDAFLDSKESSEFDKERMVFRTLTHNTTEGRDMVRTVCETLNSDGLYALVEEAYLRRLQNARVSIVVDKNDDVHNLAKALSDVFDYDTEVWWLEDQVAYISLRADTSIDYAETSPDSKDTVTIHYSELVSSCVKGRFQPHNLRSIVLSRILLHFYISEYRRFTDIWTSFMNDNERLNVYGMVSYEYLEKFKNTF